MFDCHLVRARPNKALVIPEFLVLALNARHTSSELVARSNTTTMTTIDQGKLASVPILVPTKAEQLSAIEAATKVISETLRAALHINKHIQLLQAQRIGLITTAVTGQLDVRNYKAEGLAACQ